MLKILASIMTSAALFQLFPVAVMEMRATGEYRPVEASAYVGVSEDAESGEAVAAPEKIDLNSYGIVTSGFSSIVIDDASGDMLWGEQPHQIRSIGSVTKLMTALVFMEQNPNVADFVTLQEEDMVLGGRVYLAFNDALQLGDVLAASLVGSDNTATKALMRFSGMTEEEFIARMNEKATELGMILSQFTDVTGVDSQNISTASDLVKLLKAAGEVPVIARWTTAESVIIRQRSGRTIEIENTNLALQLPVNRGEYDMLVGKTGFLPLAGYVLASTVEHNGNRLHIVTLGAESTEARAADIAGLGLWAFRVHRWPNDIGYGDPLF